MWKAGDTFKGNVIKKGNEHLHIILSDPYLSETGETVVLTFMSTYNGNSNTEEDSCVIEQGEHPFAKHRSYLVFSDCREVSVSALDKELQKGTIERREPLSKELLRRAIDGMQSSRNVKRDLKDRTKQLQLDLME